MLRQRLQQLILAGFAVAVLIGAAPRANATCRQVRELVAQGFSIGEIAAGLGAPVGAVQACLQPVAFAGHPNRVVGGATDGAVFSAPGPPPLGAAGPPPLGAAGPPPLGAPGPAPFGAAGGHAPMTSSGTSFNKH